MQMKMVLKLAMCLSAIAFLGTAAIADEVRPAKGEWSGFTVDQLAEHLRLTGGNIDLEFESPVYLNVQAVVKEGADKPREITLDYWGSKPSKHYHLFFKVKDITEHRNELTQVVLIEYTGFDRGRNDEQGVTGHPIHSTGGLFGQTFTIKAERAGRRGAWLSNTLEVPVGTPITIYQLLDTDAPDDNYRKITILFTHSRPPHEE
jgi:hypothetical protein